MAATVSVIIGTYNRAHFIDEALQTILNQSPPPNDIIVVDDGSDDGTADRLARYANQIRYVYKKNGGRPSALNAGLRLATGDYIWIFDDDDLAIPGALAAWVTVLDRRPELGFVYSTHLIGETDEKGRVVRTRALRLDQFPNEDEFSKVLRTYCFAMQAMLVRRSAYDAAGFFDEGLLRSADYEMMIRLAYLFPFARLEKPAFILRQHQGPRGPKVLRHDGGDKDRTRVHMKFDGRVGLKVRDKLRLAEYVYGPRATRALTITEERLALLTRMSIMASKGLLTEMLADLEAACVLHESRHKDLHPKLTAQERAVCEEAMHFQYFWLRVLEDSEQFLRGVRRAAFSRFGRQILRSFARAMFIHAKSYGEPIPERIRRLNYMLQLGTMSYMPAGADRGPNSGGSLIDKSKY